ncbi:MAG: hypothetical protein COZ06_16550 [Armatimonadetes bacterium CG_4_10_14_3_um_filter_66_18]|nr:MAG: hypothetical protein COW34_07360 [Armatimonadetes bacterium CG17_big_fil_post_rev_8_21_14_2_50_66_6]PIX46734.1 MAG: hypothetical protein COZ57_10525 [Armatimonadetes bacterium CG_4_8_14_3_um_filter_66_20]PIY48425.1 MAG: hypothetical protein COZ06_16550 [Armatimonadetes bacterium CG_4_10_14_3_um_filter_66_18]
MDIDAIRAMIRDGDWVPTEHFNERLDERTIDLEQVLESIACGEIVHEEPKQSPCPECMIRGLTRRRIAGIEFEVPLYVQCGIGEVVFFITADWNPPRQFGQRARRSRHR